MCVEIGTRGKYWSLYRIKVFSSAENFSEGIRKARLPGLGAAMMGRDMQSGMERVVALVDMDCFYVQVEQRLNPTLKNKPCAVVQYKTWKGGGYREASVEVIEVMSRFAMIERASIDEAYVDLTSAIQDRLRKEKASPFSADLLPSTYIQGFPCSAWKGVEQSSKEELRQHGLHQWLTSLPLEDTSCPDLHLAVGAVIVEEMRAAIEAETSFQCSAGIAHNKMLAKLACGLNKPNRQTVIPQGSVPELFSQLPISKIRHLGGKLGASVSQNLGVEYVGQLTQFSNSQLQNHFGEKTGLWLYDLCRGTDYDPVKPRQLIKSIGCSKNFPGKTALATREQVQYWLLQLALELQERLMKDRETNFRVARQLTVSLRMQGDKRGSSMSRCCGMPRYEAQKISSDAYILIKNCNSAGAHQSAWSPPLTLLHLSASKFSDMGTLSKAGIASFLSRSTDFAKTSTTSSFSGVTTSNMANPNSKADNKKGGSSDIQLLFQRAAARRTEVAEVSEAVFPTSESLCPFSEALITSEAPLPLSEKLQHSLEVPLPASSASVSVCSLKAGPSITLDKTSNETISFFQSRAQEQLIKPSLGNSSVLLRSAQSIQQSAAASASFVPPCNPSSQGNLGIQTTSPVRDSDAHVEVESFEDHSVVDTDNFPLEDLVQCEKCGQKVVVWELPEHMDFHFALELQQSFSLCNSPRPHAFPNSSKPSSVTSDLRGKNKPKSQAASSSKRPKRQLSQTLDYFFKRTPL
ncbi:DNA polymerase eta isoform X2 [Microcaecilia unicolor]|uniref:DNA polymerase eta n=1 Tax=Microcaecilia unicolor TaxID=1415580 RepID=A0A6P7XET8_9AMPH|nr:DNA polymerase eta isoform X2 [Microcaecilia unicolor]